MINWDEEEILLYELLSSMREASARSDAAWAAAKAVGAKVRASGATQYSRAARAPAEQQREFLHSWWPSDGEAGYAMGVARLGEDGCEGPTELGEQVAAAHRASDTAGLEFIAAKDAYASAWGDLRARWEREQV